MPRESAKDHVYHSALQLVSGFESTLDDAGQLLFTCLSHFFEGGRGLIVLLTRILTYVLKLLDAKQRHRPGETES
jgi:hypothetical protein